MAREEENTLLCAVDLFDGLPSDSKCELLPEDDVFGDLDPLEYTAGVPPFPAPSADILPVPAPVVEQPVPPVEQKPQEDANGALSAALENLFTGFAKLDEASANQLYNPYNRRRKRQKC